MDKLVPPPNGSPEEIEAWNNMMDTMVTFIRASTNLMNTITLKVRPVPGGGAIPVALPPNLMHLMDGCEPECETCIPKPKPKCGVCTAKKPARRSLTDNAPAKAPSRALSTSNSKMPGVTPSAPGDASPNAIPAAIPEAQEESPAEEVELASPENEEEPAPPAEESEPAPPAEESEPAPPAEENEPAPPAEENEPAPSASKEVAEQPAPASQKPSEIDKTDQPGSNTNTGCVCSAIRAKRLEDSQKATEESPPPEEEEQPLQEPLEHLCACGPTDGNHASMVQDMAEKLANAQQEIEILQEEMMKLQRMDASRKTAHGGPNPAALYREIMRNSEVQNPCPRDRSSQRIPPHVRQRSQNSVNLGLDCSECPGNRSMSNPVRRRVQSNTSGFDMSIPTEGMQLPEGFVGCIPCDNNPAASNYGISQALPRQMQRQGSMQALMQQRMHMSMQQQNMTASRQGMLNRTGSQGGATQIPARRNSGPGGTSGFRSYQDAPNAGGASGFRTMQSFPDPPGSSSRRVVMCGPPPQSQGGCNSCQNR